MNISRQQELSRCDAMLLLDTCVTLGLYDGEASNACRLEDAEAVRQLIEREIATGS